MKNSSINKESTIHKFDSFCKKILKNESIDIERKNRYLRQVQILFCELSEEQKNSLFSNDLYLSDYYSFNVNGFKIHIVNEALGEAIKLLPELRQKIILLSYFIGYNDKEISGILNVSQDTVWYQRNVAIKTLRKILGVKKNEFGT
ncbi:sigma-70 family RNA polymerase sigma factor [Clostridioides difficile]|uniref:RNA polymerase sigma factor n=1 Tax=Clostridia TaxID=186801 RepID=UPI0003B2AB21|nr:MULTISPECIES: sigma-70 family RNA polymerase sigma factor [Clostridia]EGT4547881.1 sigma-70 family RNA polymerase sigma factor [Clostridioides difficile]EGT4615277.1 sigma-70 family RNA polymerase sigma factor [Clostridioides difficile]EGT4733130.1 sigma-70 family RNA polymerase sigma factor [Clostridioides difficile]EGT4782051.1 sigma-70 family RNA polymerase sigma factor [Clostridioides difficile]EGT5366245.1 sigma-70 family RNA polymerase sigma factor [Clostridioides difficile]